MSILVNADTKVLVQGLTGNQGRFYGLRNRAYGTKVVAGVRAGKAGTDVDGIPVFDTVKNAVTETGATVSMLIVPVLQIVPAPSLRLRSGWATSLYLQPSYPLGRAGEFYHLRDAILCARGLFAAMASADPGSQRHVSSTVARMSSMTVASLLASRVPEYG